MEEKEGRAVATVSPTKAKQAFCPVCPVSQGGSSGSAAGAPEPERAQEDVKVKVLSTPVRPSKKKIEEHEACGHVPFKSWCAFCMRSRGKSFAHTAVEDKDEEAIPTVSI